MNRRYIAAACLIAALPFYSGCSRIERMAEEHDREAKARLAPGRFIKKNVNRVEKGFEIFKEMMYNSLRQ